LKLRSRLVLTAVAVLVPTMVGLFVADAMVERSAAEKILTGILTARLPMEREACESNPESWGSTLVGPRLIHRGPPRPDFAPPSLPPPTLPRPPFMIRGLGFLPPPPSAFVYDEHFGSQNPAAPVLARAVIDGVRENGVAVVPMTWRRSDVEVVVRSPWASGACAYVLARGAPLELAGLLPATNVWALPLAILLGAVLLAVGPVLRRIQALTDAVRRSASSAYESEIVVDGSDEIGELARAFDAAGREIRSQIKERDRRERALRDFLANTTHDVMIPLTVLQGHLTSLAETAPTTDTSSRAIVSSAMAEAHYIASLVHNLGMAARLEVADAQLHKDRVDLGALIQRVVGRHTFIARELQVSIECATPTTSTCARADLTLLEQAVSNIAYNAVRYNRAGGHVAITVEREPPDHFVIRIIDDGPGIPEAELVKLTERGARGNEARTRAPEGRGLGIDIARRAAEMHGFQLTFLRSEYGGLEVRFAGQCV
jgi:two-component system sensor histidine kinase BaeS